MGPMKAFMLLVLLSVAGFAQIVTGAATIPHSVSIQYADPNTPSTGDTSNVYRAPGPCPAVVATAVVPNANFVKLNGAPITNLQYGDSSVAAATTYCYVISIVNSAGLESVGNQAYVANVPPNPTVPSGPTGVVIVIK